MQNQKTGLRAGLFAHKMGKHTAPAVCPIRKEVTTKCSGSIQIKWRSRRQLQAPNTHGEFFGGNSQVYYFMAILIIQGAIYLYVCLSKKNCLRYFSHLYIDKVLFFQ